MEGTLLQLTILISKCPKVSLFSKLFGLLEDCA